MTTQAEKQRAIERRIDYTPEYRLAKRLIDVLAADYGFDNVRAILHNRSRTCVCERQSGKFTLKFGYAFLDNTKKNGSRWLSQDYMFGDPVEGLEAIYRVAIHEFAHVIVLDTFFKDRDAWTRPASHGSEFFEAIDELTKLYPFSDAVKYARPWTDPENGQETDNE